MCNSRDWLLCYTSNAKYVKQCFPITTLYETNMENYYTFITKAQRHHHLTSHQPEQMNVLMKRVIALCLSRLQLTEWIKSNKMRMKVVLEYTNSLQIVYFCTKYRSYSSIYNYIVMWKLVFCIPQNLICLIVTK